MFLAHIATIFQKFLLLGLKSKLFISIFHGYLLLLIRARFEHDCGTYLGLGHVEDDNNYNFKNIYDEDNEIYTNDSHT